jgi:hypothetical protein
MRNHLVEVLKKQVKTSKPGEEKVWEDFTGEEVITSNPSTLTDGQAVAVSRNP